MQYLKIHKLSLNYTRTPYNIVKLVGLFTTLIVEPNRVFLTVESTT